MTLNALFLPLLGGFLFYHLFNHTAQLAPYHPPQTLLFWAAASGCLTLLAARESLYLFEGVQGDRHLVAAIWLNQFAPPLLAAFLVGASITFMVLWLEARVALEKKAPRAPRLSLARALITWEKFIWIAVCCLAAVIGWCTVLSFNASQIFGIHRWTAWTLLTLLIVTLGYMWSRYTSMMAGNAIIRVSIVLLGMLTVAYFVLNNWDVLLLHWKHLRQPVPIVQRDGLGSAFCSLVFSIVFAQALNFLYPKAVAGRTYYRGKWTSELEKIAHEAARDGLYIMLTMRDRKVYVGSVINISTNHHGKGAFIVLLPTKSGYREKDTATVRFTTEYGSICAQLSDGDRNKFHKIFPVSEIVSAGFFEERYFEQFDSRSEPASNQNSAPQHLTISTLTIKNLQVAKGPLKMYR